jgi:small subunit ribosomal protein S10
MIQSIEISFKSFEYTLIENSYQQIQSFVPKNWKLFSYYLPNKMKKITVLRSPHIDKRSREQFQIKSYKKNIRILPPIDSRNLGPSVVHEKLELDLQSRISTRDSDHESILLFLENLKQCPISGVQMQIQIIYTSFLWVK